MVRFEQLAVIVPLSVVVALVLIIAFNGMPQQTDEQKAAANTMANQDNHPQSLHTRPMCVDSVNFRANVAGKWRSCGWVAHNAAERCGSTLATDNNGNQVYAKDACYLTCDTGNCRRRGLRNVVDETDVAELSMNMEEEPLN